MEDKLESYPLSKSRQGALFERNPVCALCFRVCKELCDTYGSIHFDLLRSMQAADSLCAYFVEHAWELPDVVRCRQWLENHLNNDAEVMCACAVLSLSISAMIDVPEPLRSRGQDIRCLIYGEANRLYNILHDAVWHEHLIFSAGNYGCIQPLPADLRNKMPIILIPPKQPIRMEAKQYNQYNGPVYQGCTFTTTNTTNNYYGQMPSSSVSPETIVSPVGKESHSEKDPDKTDLRVKRLFTIDGIEDIERTTEESNRFLNFLSDHNIRSRLIDSSQDNPILKAAVCFCAKWKSLRFIESDISPKAVLRFLTINCELKCDNIDEKAIRNTLARMIRKGYDQVLFGDVCDYF